MTDARARRIYRLINALFWLAIWGATVHWTGTWGTWWVMALQAAVPLAFEIGRAHV